MPARRLTRSSARGVVIHAYVAALLISAVQCALETPAATEVRSTGVWASAARGFCANDACTNSSDDGVSVETCVQHSVTCYARACRFYDRCDRVPLAIWPNGTIELIGAVRGDTGPASRLARLVGGWRNPEGVVGASDGGGAVAEGTAAWFAAAGVPCGVVEPRTSAVVVDYYNLENYYHFHVDFMLRLFAQLERSEASGGGVPIMFPAVPAWPGPGIDPHAEYWDDATSSSAESLPFWIQGLQALQAFAQSAANQGTKASRVSLGAELAPGAVVPLSRESLRALTQDGPLCLSSAFLGLPFVDLERGGGYNISHRGEHVEPREDWTQLESVQLDAHGITRNVASTADWGAAAYLQRFTAAVRRGLGLGTPVAPRQHGSAEPVRVALISRSRRRKIVNEAELLAAVEAALPSVHLTLLQFERMTYREQVRAAGEVDVLMGMNGAGLTNAVYRHRCAVAVQLMPYRAPLNFREFGLLLRAGGPYMEWHNVREADSVTPQGPGMHQPASNQGTRVLAGEFVQLVREAVALHEACVAMLSA